MRAALSTYTLNQDGTLSAIGTVGDGGTALCWLSESNGYYYGSNAGSGTVSSFTVSPTGVPSLDEATATVTHAGTTDSTVSPDGKVLYVESGGTGALDAFAIAPDGSLSPIQTTWNLPVGFEGIVAS